ncbi:hypothetical protein P7K49_028413 [Saguinus oedipus]|uniref:Uncharacterized protein n=1 Tax=Saguinus oedipus TaxID=9490 RepID=A0ABQ9UD16_SAGOE|nr:hypothetical protein P7K49_028413 [Saguinus oedipus]
MSWGDLESKPTFMPGRKSDFKGSRFPHSPKPSAETQGSLPIVAGEHDLPKMKSSASPLLASIAAADFEVAQPFLSSKRKAQKSGLNAGSTALQFSTCCISGTPADTISDGDCAHPAISLREMFYAHCHMAIPAVIR